MRPCERVGFGAHLGYGFGAARLLWLRCGGGWPYSEAVM
jgi:hypothetical protein